MSAFPDALPELPPHLAERRTDADPRPPREAGDCVVYWLRTAQRAHENPALDAARGWAAALDRPLLIYQGIDERTPYASDRHHAFQLQGARDLAEECAALGLRYALHVSRPGQRPSALVELARRAAVVVTERFPAPPLVGWTHGLRSRCEAPVVEIDTACVVPMTATTRAPSRAFAFRDGTRKAREAALAADWPELEASENPGEVRAFEDTLPFDEVDPRTSDLDRCIGACAIDHGVGPVPGERGGSAAGYERWRAFVEDGGLSRYAKMRNDALRRDGVSRMSAYLHYGMVSPFRLAREARAQGGKGAEKFLDELLIWRELAYHWCHHLDGDVEGLDALPDWARADLADTAGDARTTQPDEALERGTTGDALWDACQRSLRVRGELHNNVRMTWGKALLGWSRDGEQALRRLIDLNHRFALDGRDPASYGGLLWCLGLFDRPFPPARPVTGRLRLRETRVHAERLDIAAFVHSVRAPEGGPARIAVIGAGLAGLSAARALHDHGHDVTVFDKARGPGGRTSLRRGEPWAFDHGAQYFTARDPRFRRQVAQWIETGVVERWEPRLVALEAGRAQPAGGDVERFVGVPGMNAMAKSLAGDLHTRQGARVTEIEVLAEGFALRAEEGAELGRYDRVVLALPAGQAAELCPDLALAERASAVEMSPCWALLAGFDQPLEIGFDAAFVQTGPLGWIARNSSKPGRPAAEAWVLHAGPDWSAAHWDEAPEAVAAELLEAFRSATGCELPAPAHLDRHRWRYSLASGALDEEFMAAPSCPGLVLAGDWLAGSRVEGAFLSGRAAAGHLLRGLALAPASSEAARADRR
jgi:photolyase PhrII